MNLNSPLATPETVLEHSGWPDHLPTASQPSLAIQETRFYHLILAILWEFYQKLIISRYSLYIVLFSLYVSSLITDI